MTRRAELAKIHIAKTQLGLDDETYRALLERVTGKNSAGSLDADQRRRVLAEFEKLGWKPARPAAAAPHGADAQRRKIAAMLKAGGKPAEYGQGIAKKMFGRRLEFCSPAQLRAVIAALEKDRQRRGAEE